MAFSQVDFNRMQDQLIVLREASYKKDENYKKQEKELTLLKEKFINLEKNLSKANQTINKSKKVKEYDDLSRELDRMRRKRDVQEEESRIQSDELIKQLTEFVTANERLVEENDRLKGKKDVVNMEEYSGLQMQLRRLQAQYAALHKCTQISSCNNTSSTTPNSLQLNEHDDAYEENNHNKNNDQNSNNNCNNNNKNEINNNTNVNNNDKNNKEFLLTELRLRVETEKEENALMKLQLSQNTAKQKEELEVTRKELERVEEKLRKKQESCLSLQESNDSLLKEMNGRAAGDAETKGMSDLQGKCDRLSKENKRMEACNIVNDKRVQDFEREKASLEGRLRAQQDELAGEESRGKMEQKQQLIDEQMNLIEDMKAQVRESQSVHEKAVEEIGKVRKEFDKLTLKFQHVTKVAESRKQHLDTMAIKYTELIDSSKDRLQQLTLANQQQAHKYNLEIEAYKGDSKDLKDMKIECQSLKRDIEELRGGKEAVEGRLKEVEDEVVANEKQQQKQVEAMQRVQAEDAQTQLTLHSTQLLGLEDKLKATESSIESLKDSLQQKEAIIKDHGEDKKLHEKKGKTVIKDLKKQLDAERRRSEKTQERLQGVLCDNKHRQSVEDLFRPVDLKGKSNENSSLSSWSPSGVSRDTYQGADDESEANISSENEELIKKVTQLQQDVCLNKEKVSHLENSNAAMAEDLLEKTAIIKHYHMNNKAGQPTSNHSHHDSLLFKRVISLLSDHTDKVDKQDTQMHKRLQHIIEETLTKNMHLQNDVELLSKELATLKASGV